MNHNPRKTPAPIKTQQPKIPDHINVDPELAELGFDNDFADSPTAIVRKSNLER